MRHRFGALLGVLSLTLFVAAPIARGACEPENPYLFCDYDCRNGACVHDLYTPVGSWCLLTFPGCNGGQNHECCDDAPSLF